ncbi:MAG: assimilatory sulfite reductase (NADPH) hemoprotein subunit [Gammaproteobacteria bacterium]|nr:assimilatory sulfite reductase (NADPH) hemoprotein subunit [Gammaproteobacteria bacterium]
MVEKAAQLSEVEDIKQTSNFLRGNLIDSLANPVTGALAESDTQISKFHGIYQQDDRDLRAERRRQKLEPAYRFMIRVRVPGGICTPEQWLALDKLAGEYANGSLRLTTRQAIQYHGVLKHDLKPTIAAINKNLLDTIAACGDVNRNVMCSPNPVESAAHCEVYDWAAKISEHLTPKTRAYHEIWLDGKKLLSTEQDHEPIYGNTYLPRKFKAAVVIPPRNDVDIFTQDLGFIAIIENDELLGFNITVGGGMGMSHGEPATYPRLADIIGFCRPEQVLDVAENVVAVQRDYGDRGNRKHARLKYTIDDRGIDWFKTELENYLGWRLAAPRPYYFVSRGDRYGWVPGDDGGWHFTIFIQSGRVADSDNQLLRTGLREIAKIHQGDFRITPNQNLTIANVPQAEKNHINSLLDKYGIANKGISRLRANSMACVAFPTCGLAMAESERYLPTLLDKLEVSMRKHGLVEDAIVIRMTGCPNGCARPYAAEIGLVGKGPGKYNLYLGASFTGDRLNKLYKENIGEQEILSSLDQLFAHYARARRDTERFGDFVIRAGYVEAVTQGRQFHE